jgi:hypothetical protein
MTLAKQFQQPCILFGCPLYAFDNHYIPQVVFVDAMVVAQLANSTQAFFFS